jgi:hypothetical protein
VHDIRTLCADPWFCVVYVLYSFIDYSQFLRTYDRVCLSYLGANMAIFNIFWQSGEVSEQTHYQLPPSTEDVCFSKHKASTLPNFLNYKGELLLIRYC